MSITDWDGLEITNQVKDLALSDEVVKTVHHLLDASSIVPPVHVEDVDVVCPQLPERILHRDVHGLEVVPGVVHLLENIR